MDTIKTKIKNKNGHKFFSYFSPSFAPPAKVICTCPSSSKSNSNILYFELKLGPSLGLYIFILGELNKLFKISIKPN